MIFFHCLLFHSVPACNFLTQNAGLVHEDCIAKMRLMSLVDLASCESGHIPYSLVKDTLRVNLFFSCCKI